MRQKCYFCVEELATNPHCAILPAARHNMGYICNIKYCPPCDHQRRHSGPFEANSQIQTKTIIGNIKKNKLILKCIIDRRIKAISYSIQETPLDWYENEIKMITSYTAQLPYLLLTQNLQFLFIISLMCSNVKVFCVMITVACTAT